MKIKNSPPRKVPGVPLRVEFPQVDSEPVLRTYDKRRVAVKRQLEQRPLARYPVCTLARA
jgi:hypothetical protein